ncbi:MAG: porin [Myxococcota bacterium]|nr:porin [Myxococcota bacterium]
MPILTHALAIGLLFTAAVEPALKMPSIETSVSSGQAIGTTPDAGKEARSSTTAPNENAPDVARSAEAATPSESKHQPAAKSVSLEVQEMAEMPAAVVGTPQVKQSFEIAFSGYLRAFYSTFLPEKFFGVPTPKSMDNQGNPFVGRNDGFGLSGARLNVRGTLGENLYLRLGFDGALVNYEDTLDSVGGLATGLKDAYIRWRFGDSMNLFVGRFKPPFDMEELTATEDQQFVHRALESRGVKRHEGYATHMGGFAPGRQMGVMLSDDAVFGLGAMDFGYGLAITNGNRGGGYLNDNDLPAVYGRFFTSWGSAGVSSDEEGPSTQIKRESGGVLGVAGYFNQKTTGAEPEKFAERDIGLGVDTHMSYWGIEFQGQVMMSWLERLDAPLSKAQQSLGGHAQLAYAFGDSGFELAYRYAFYNPRFVSADESGDDSTYHGVSHNTVGLRYLFETMPAIFYIEYTHSGEFSGRELANDRVETAIQVTF